METNYKLLKLVAEWTGEKSSIHADKDNSARHFTIFVENIATETVISFDYWSSIARPEFETETELLEAYECFVSDAILGINSFSDFCSETGCDSDSIKSHKTWIACKQSYVDLLKLLAPEVVDDSQLYSYLDDLRSYIDGLNSSDDIAERNTQLFQEVFEEVKRRRNKGV